MNATVQQKLKSFFTTYPVQHYKKGETVIHPEETHLATSYLASGNLREYSISSEGTELTLHIYSPGTFLPMTWIIADIPNRFYFEAVNEVVIYTAPKQDVLQFLQKNSDVLLDLTRRLLLGLDKLSLRLESMVFDSALKRLGSMLVFLASHFGVSKEEGILLQEQFTHRNIGTLVGITRETTTRTLDILKQRGLISYKKDRILILDIEQLKNLMEG